MSRFRLLVPALLLLVVTSPAAAQQLHFMREAVLRPQAPQDQVVVDRVRADLAAIRTAQETYFAANQTYAAELSELKGVKLSGGTSAVILMASPMGWKAEAANTALQGTEVVHVMRMKEGDACPMMGGGGMGGMKSGMGGGMMGGKEQGGDCCRSGAEAPGQHRH